jgi:hypothetical protein
VNHVGADVLVHPVELDICTPRTRRLLINSSTKIN